MDTFIIDGTRTPIGSLGGALALVRTDDLAAHSIRSLMNKYSFIDPLDIDDVILDVLINLEKIIATLLEWPLY